MKIEFNVGGEKNKESVVTTLYYEPTQAYNIAKYLYGICCAESYLFSKLVDQLKDFYPDVHIEYMGLLEKYEAGQVVVEANDVFKGGNNEQA